MYFLLKWIDSEDLEKEKEELEPVQYHEAWKKLCGCSGILVPGGFGNRGTEGKISAINWARKKNIPFLGEKFYYICDKTFFLISINGLYFSLQGCVWDYSLQLLSLQETFFS